MSEVQPSTRITARLISDLHTCLHRLAASACPQGDCPTLLDAATLINDAAVRGEEMRRAFELPTEPPEGIPEAGHDGFGVGLCSC